MPISTSRQYVATSYDGVLELWDPIKKIRSVHELPPDTNVVKVECYYQGGVALTSTGKVIFFSHGDRNIYASEEVITDISCSEKDLVMTTAAGKFIKIGKRGHYLTTAPPPLQISIGPAKIAYITSGKLYVGEDPVSHHCAVVQVAVGGGHTLFLNEEGGLYGFGNNQHGQLGEVVVDHAQYPVLLEFKGKIKKIVAGHEHSVLLDEEGSVWITGSNFRGQLGEGIETGDNCRRGFTLLREKVADIYARGSVTMLDFVNFDIESIGAR